MGWYLLGRQYEEQGKEKKALYCYAKAGEVFEAYEKKKLPATVEKEAEQLAAAAVPSASHTDATDRRSDVEDHESDSTDEADEAARAVGNKVKTHSLSRRLRLAAILALLLAGILYSPSMHAPGQEAGERSQEEPTVTAAPTEPSGTHPVQAAKPAKLTGVVFIGKGSSEEEKKQKAGSLLLNPPDSGESVMLAEAPLSADKKWILWTTSPRPLLEVKQTQGGTTEIDYYDQASCQCTPDDGAQADKKASDWLAKEEERAVLRSAADAYQKEKGSLPTTAAALVGDYPRNRLSGLTAAMKELWPLLAAKGGTGATPSPSSSPASGETDSDGLSTPKASKTPAGSAPPASGAVNPHTPLEQPLEIIVDRRNHRLAVVSGRVILRNYPVGLGGKRTPTGVFEISEKVKNPNGRSDGDFGSRGMTLSATDYAIHGTNEPESIGKDESLGCIRVGKDDLEELFDLTPMGTKVTITDGKLPNELIRAKSRFHLPADAKETNPAKVYRWLD
ncbi:L,D-transpeptidase [Gorillibacterium timonense]